jgi:hypothetical protein
VDPIRSAVFTQGIQRIEDIPLSHCFGDLVTRDKGLAFS